jgi:hypothetical protein
LEVNVKVAEFGFSAIYPGLAGFTVLPDSFAVSDIPCRPNLEDLVIGRRYAETKPVGIYLVFRWWEYRWV